MAMKKYRLRPNVGVHVGSVGQDENGDEIPAKVYHPGDTVACRKNLAEIWPEKWEQVDDNAKIDGVVGPEPKPQAPAAPAHTAPNVTGPLIDPKAAAQTTPTATTVAPSASTPIADDATASFPLAVTHALQVWGTEANGYLVRETDVPNSGAINPSPLSRAEMDEFLKKYTAG